MYVCTSKHHLQMPHPSIPPMLTCCMYDLCTLQEKLQAECGLRPTEIVVGGSIGHRTALPWKFDADIVIYSEGERFLLLYDNACCGTMAHHVPNESSNVK